MTQADNQSNRVITRRGFINRTAGTAMAAALFPSICHGSTLGRNGASAPGNRVTLGVIGCGPQGLGDMGNFLNEKDCQVLAVCDVKNDQLEQARNAVNRHYQNQDCGAYHDFRELVARADIDACLIATPDHWHVAAALAAARSGKDVYVEKPLGLSLEEDQILRAVLRKKKRVFQFGTQQRSGRMFRFASELARSGAIGKLRHINVWAPGSAPGGSQKVVPVPAGWDYERWLGPAPFTPYTQDRCSAEGQKKTWWFTSDYALGFIAGWGIHPMDIALWGAGDLMDGLVTIEGRGNFRAAEGICDTATIWEVDYQFSSGLTMKFVGVPNGGNSDAATGEPFLHGEEWKERYRRITTHGTAFEGTDGWAHVDRAGINLEPEKLIDVKEADCKIQLKRSAGHARDFIDCVKSRAETVSPIDAAVKSDVLCHIADIAIRLRRKITFDMKKEQFISDDAANRRLKARPMRKPWDLHGLNLAMVLLLLLVAGVAGVGAADSARDPRVLVFSKTLGYRHASITNGIATIRELGTKNGFNVEATEDSNAIGRTNLSRFQAVVFLSVTGDVLDSEQEAVFKEYLLDGGGFVAIHGSIFGPSACEDHWKWYGDMWCCAFTNHSAVCPGTVVIEDAAHPSTIHLPNRWLRTEEWYNYTGNPRGCARVLATVDETTYQGGTVGGDHPIAWCRRIGKGRMWYTAMGHTESSFREPLFMQHLLGGIQVAAGWASGDFTPNSKPQLNR